MRITSKGQITIPKKLRDRFGINAETEIEIIESDGVLQIRKKQTEQTANSWKKWIGAFSLEPGKENVEDLIASMRGRDK
jgi:AbrB family looped-hinge helix DNA binding protein